MNILIISFFDDNYGDMLIRICFEQLLKVVLKNLNIKESYYYINNMPLKSIDEDKIKQSNLILFAGGGLFGLSYLNFFEYIDKITKIACEEQIPVVFSSLGINNMNATKENEKVLKDILKRDCIKSISVRENLELFKEYAKECELDIKIVCDPAVWTKYVYRNNIETNNLGTTKIVGINVVRGGLFKDNGIAWKLSDEEKYLLEIKNKLQENDIDYRFFTNGSFLDNNAMLHFKDKYKIPDEKIIINNTTKEVVKTISKCNAVIAIRMHASIISYAMSIPSINLVWNEKIPLFYKNIGYPERAIHLDKWNIPFVFENVENLLNEEKYYINNSYLMSLYEYLFNTLKEIINVNEIKMYSFDDITKFLSNQEINKEQDIIDLRVKIQKGSKSYLSLFNSDQDRKLEIKQLKINNKKLQEENHRIKNEYNEKLRNAEEKLENEQEKYKKIKEKLINEQLKSKKIKKQLEKINNKLIVKVYRKMKRNINKILRK